MDPPPNLIAPVIIVACALIVVGGIGTALSSSEDAAANGLPGRPAGERDHGSGDRRHARPPHGHRAGAGGAANETASDANATLPSRPTPERTAGRNA